MIPAWVTFAALLFVVTGCAVALVVLPDRARRDERERAHRHIDHLVGLQGGAMHDLRQALMERIDALEEARKQAIEASAAEARWHRQVEEEREHQHAEELRDLRQQHEAAMAALVNRLTIGTDRPAAPEIARYEDPETIARRQIHLDTVKNGMEQMRRAYKEAGIDRTDEELREEVEDMLAGAGVVHRFEPHGDLAVMVRD